MAYKIAVATSDGVYVDTHFGHTDSFLILDVNEDDGSYEEIEEIQVEAACGTTDTSDGGGCRRGKAFEAIANALSEVSFVLCASCGPKAERVLREHGIVILEIIQPIDLAVARLNIYRDRYRLKKPEVL